MKKWLNIIGLIGMVAMPAVVFASNDVCPCGETCPCGAGCPCSR